MLLFIRYASFTRFTMDRFRSPVPENAGTRTCRIVRGVKHRRPPPVPSSPHRQHWSNPNSGARRCTTDLRQMVIVVNRAIGTEACQRVSTRKRVTNRYYFKVPSADTGSTAVESRSMKLDTVSTPIGIEFHVHSPSPSRTVEMGFFLITANKKTPRIVLPGVSTWFFGGRTR